MMRSDRPRRSHPLDPIRPSLSMGRITSGIIGGLAGGLLFGTLLLTDAVMATPRFQDEALGASVAELLGTTSVVRIWAAHSVMSALFGAIFSMLIVPNSYRSNVLWALGYGVVLWLVADLFVLRTLTGEPFAFDAGAAVALIGHLLYGLGLGLVYVAFHDLEIREADRTESERWRRWGRREREETEG